LIAQGPKLSVLPNRQFYTRKHPQEIYFLNLIINISQNNFSQNHFWMIGKY